MQWTAMSGFKARQAPTDGQQPCVMLTDNRHLSIVVLKGSIDQGRSPVQCGIPCASGGGTGGFFNNT